MYNQQDHQTIFMEPERRVNQTNIYNKSEMNQPEVSYKKLMPFLLSI